MSIQTPASTHAPASVARTSEPPVRIIPTERVLHYRPTLPARGLEAVASAVEWLFGLMWIFVGLAVAATIPIVQFISLGYLLEACGRVARSGRFRDGFIGVRNAARAGSIVTGTSIMILPLWAISSFAYDAGQIASGSGVATGWRIALMIATAVFLAHVVSVWFCGGRLRQFFWPFVVPFVLGMWVVIAICRRLLKDPSCPPRDSFRWRLLNDLGRERPDDEWWFVPAILFNRVRRGNIYQQARDSVWDYFVQLEVRYFFWLGLRGFVGAMAWLAVPVTFLIGSTHLPSGPPAALSGLLGAGMLMVVMLYLPFLQAHFAADGRLKTMFRLGEVRHLFRRAPIAWWLALLVTLLFALPLFLLKVELTPREVMWLPSLVFVLFIFPARLVTGWALARARNHKTPRLFVSRWLARLAAVPVVAFYVLMTFLTQFISWNGAWDVYEQHAFLLPVPFFGM